MTSIRFIVHFYKGKSVAQQERQLSQTYPASACAADFLE